jgi:hypothetical protein
VHRKQYRGRGHRRGRLHLDAGPNGRSFRRGLHSASGLLPINACRLRASCGDDQMRALAHARGANASRASEKYRLSLDARPLLAGSSRSPHNLRAGPSTGKGVQLRASSPSENGGLARSEPAAVAAI